MNPQPNEQRRERAREEARRAILDATEAILSEHGVEGFSIRSLAARCGYTAPTIYHHFRDKDGLIDALLEERFSRLLARLERVQRGPDPLANARAYANAYLHFGATNPTFYRLMMRGPRDGEARVVKAADAARAIMSEPFAQLAAERRLSTEDVVAVSQALWALLHGITAIRIGKPSYSWSKNLSDVALNAFFTGITRTPPASSRGSNGKVST